jgi:nucleotide-binding universal stress UspA family protein
VITLKRILVATDFSQAARRGVWRAGNLAQRHGAAIQIVHARPDWNLYCRASSVAREYYAGLSEHAEQAMKAELEYLQETYGVRARGEISIGQASEVLARATAQFEPDLLVVGARGEHDAASTPPFLGGTALKLLAQSQCAILLVRTQGTGPYASTLAAVDTAADVAVRIIEWADVLLEEGDCHLVHAFDVPYLERMRTRGVPSQVLSECIDEARQAAQRAVDRMFKQTEPSTQALHVHLVRGEPIVALLAEIERCAPELVVVGKHQTLPLERATRFVGTIALRLAYHAPTDVLLVP